MYVYRGRTVNSLPYPFLLRFVWLKKKWKSKEVGFFWAWNILLGSTTGIYFISIDYTHTPPQKKKKNNKIVVRHGILNRLDPDTWNFFTNSVLPLDAYSIGSNFILHFLWIYSLSKLQSAGINNLPVWGSIYISGKIKRKRSTILRKIGAFHAKQYSVCNTSFSMFH